MPSIRARTCGLLDDAVEFLVVNDETNLTPKLLNLPSRKIFLPVFPIKSGR
jgi:hypothetical protein